MWHNPAHMTAGHAAAAKSSKTPKHLIPHLKGLSMKTVQGKPITGTNTQMKPRAIAGEAGSQQQAQSQIKASPMPFQNPKAVANLPAPKGPVPGVSPTNSKHANSVSGKKASRFYGSR